MNIPAIIAYPIRATFILGVCIYFGALYCCVPFVWFYGQVRG